MRFGRSYRDVEELLAEPAVDVDHVTLYRWQRFAPLLAEADRPCRHAVGDRSLGGLDAGDGGRSVTVVDRATSSGRDVVVSERRDAAAARRCFEKAIGSTKATPVEVVTDQAAVYPKVLDELAPAGLAPHPSSTPPTGWKPTMAG